MRIATWNVNSLNVRLPHLLEYLAQMRPDIIALQETKTTDDNFPQQEIGAAGYQVVFSGQKSYNGVAILSRQPPLDAVTALPGLDDPQRRLLAATVNGIRIINVYIPNGQEVGSEKYAYKLRWLEALHNMLEQELAEHERLVLLGDYNIAPAEIDTHNPGRWNGKIMCSDKERRYFRSLLDLGLTDTIRQRYPEAGMFSWWDYRMGAFNRGRGLRIDHLLSAGMTPLDGGVNTEFRARERPSDHAPVWVDFA